MNIPRFSRQAGLRLPQCFQPINAQQVCALSEREFMNECHHFGRRMIEQHQYLAAQLIQTDTVRFNGRRIIQFAHFRSMSRLRYQQRRFGGNMLNTLIPLGGPEPGICESHDNAIQPEILEQLMQTNFRIFDRRQTSHQNLSDGRKTGKLLSKIFVSSTRVFHHLQL